MGLSFKTPAFPTLYWGCLISFFSRASPEGRLAGGSFFFAYATLRYVQFTPLFDQGRTMAARLSNATLASVFQTFDLDKNDRLNSTEFLALIKVCFHAI